MGDGPELLKRLEEEFGGGVALTFNHHFAGTVLYVPGKTSADHAIAKAMGIKVMGWIVEEYGTSRITIPVSNKGRVSVKGQDVTTQMLTERLGVAYFGGKRRSWCP